MKSPKAPDSLACFQEALLKALSEEQSAAEIKAAIEEDCSAPEWREYLEGADSEMLELAAIIFQKWAKGPNFP